MSESSKSHKSKAPKTLNFGVFICSTSRFNQIEADEKEVSDVGGDSLVDLIEKAGQKVLFRKIIADDETMIQDAAMYGLGLENLDAVSYTHLRAHETDS